MSLSTTQLIALTSLQMQHERDPSSTGSIYDIRTAKSLIARGYVTKTDNRHHWGNDYQITPEGSAAIAADNTPKAPGRPRKHESDAQRQWTYRQAQKARTDDYHKLACQLHTWVQAAQAEANTPEAARLADQCRGEDAAETLRKVTAYFADLANPRGQAQATDLPDFCNL